jgi:hypothetical protein
MIIRKIFIGIFIIAVFIIIMVAVKSQYHNPDEKSSPNTSIKTLKSLPYLTWVKAKDPSRSGVIHHNVRKSFQGLNLYCSRNLPKAYLMDMSGKIVHTWSYGKYAWQHVERCNNGDLLVIVKDKMLIRLDWNSRLKWKKKIHVHHDAAVAENDDIYVLAREDATFIYKNSPMLFLNDYIVILSSEGSIKRKISLFRVLENEIDLAMTYQMIKEWTNEPDNLLKMSVHKMLNGFFFKNSTPPDIFHTNSIEIINQDIPQLCKKGDLLISVRELNLIAILDNETGKIIWKWGSNDLCRQHHPTLLENGNILVFDNGIINKHSRIIEINPISKTIVSEYTQDHFYSERRGANQRLPNGNTLITESDSGRVFEITEDKKIVWEFYNPQIKRGEKKRAAIYRMMRIVDIEAGMGEWARIKPVKKSLKQNYTSLE